MRSNVVNIEASSELVSRDHVIVTRSRAILGRDVGIFLS